MPEYEEDPGCRYFSSSYAWNWGPQELAYDYVPAASMPVNLFGVVAMAARRIVATCEEGGYRCHQFRYLSWLQNYSSLTESFINNVTSFYASWRWCAQVAASYRTFSCNSKSAETPVKCPSGQTVSMGQWHSPFSCGAASGISTTKLVGSVWKFLLSANFVAFGCYPA